jgi:hypothetical protein
LSYLAMSSPYLLPCPRLDLVSCLFLMFLAFILSCVLAVSCHSICLHLVCVIEFAFALSVSLNPTVVRCGNRLSCGFCDVSLVLSLSLCLVLFCPLFSCLVGRCTLSCFVLSSLVWSYVRVLVFSCLVFSWQNAATTIHKNAFFTPLCLFNCPRYQNETHVTVLKRRQAKPRQGKVKDKDKDKYHNRHQAKTRT